MTPPLTDLISRLERASGPDRELDLALAQALDQPWSYIGEPPQKVFARHYTASLDAALALVEAVRPGACWRVIKRTPVHRRAWREELPFCATAGMPGEQEEAYHQTAPLALILALLRSLEAAA